MGKAFISYEDMLKCNSVGDRRALKDAKGIPMYEGGFDPDYLIEQTWKKDGIEYTWEKKGGRERETLV